MGSVGNGVQNSYTTWDEGGGGGGGALDDASSAPRITVTCTY